MTKEELVELIPSNATEIIMGMSFTTDKSATMWSHFQRELYASFDKWVDDVYDRYKFQCNRSDLHYLELTARADTLLYKY